MMLVADGLNFFLRQALFGLLPPESWGISWQLASPKKVSIVLCSGYTCTCLHVTCCHNDVRQTSTCKIHWSITRSCTPSRRSFTWGWTDDTDGPKHWGVGKLWSFIGSKHRSHVNINQCTTDKRCNYHRCFSKKKTRRLEKGHIQSILKYWIREDPSQTYYLLVLCCVNCRFCLFLCC